MAFVARLARLSHPALTELAQKSRDLLPRREGPAIASPSLQQRAFGKLKRYDFRRDLGAAGQQLLHLQGVC